MTKHGKGKVKKMLKGKCKICNNIGNKHGWKDGYAKPLWNNWCSDCFYKQIDIEKKSSEKSKMALSKWEKKHDDAYELESIKILSNLKKPIIMKKKDKMAARTLQNMKFNEHKKTMNEFDKMVDRLLIAIDMSSKKKGNKQKKSKKNIKRHKKSKKYTKKRKKTKKYKKRR